MFLTWTFQFIILVPLRITDNTDKIKITFTFKKAVQSIPSSISYWKLGWRVDEADKTAHATLQMAI